MKISYRLEQIGFNLPSMLHWPVKAVWHPLAYDWLVTLFTVGYALVVMLMGANALHLGVFQGPMVHVFSAYTIGFAGTMLIAGVVGMYGLSTLNKSLRMKSSMVLVLAYGWVAIYYYNAIPLPWQGVFLYTAHGLMEAIVYLRCASDPRHLWESPRG